MGCASSKSHSHQYNIRLPPSLQSGSDQQTLQTEADVLEDQFLQIGITITSLGEMHPKVKEIYNRLKPLFPQLDTLACQYMVLPDESLFYGVLRQGRRNGIGRQHWPREGNFLEGTWVEDHLCGKARMIYPNGDYFEGLFCDNVANGLGKFVSAKKEVTGLWIQNKLTGDGYERRTNGTIYKGAFVDGKIQGNGSFQWANGCIYKGSVSRGKMHGLGELIFPDLSKYTGEFRHNQICGRGRYREMEGMVRVVLSQFQSKVEELRLQLYFCDRESLNEPTLITIELPSHFE